MSFIWVRMLWLMLLVPVVVVVYILLQRRRKKFAVRYASLSLVRDALGRRPGLRRHVPAILFLAGIAVMLFALSRPAATVTLPSQQGTVILAIDVSGSMRADDLQPTRLEAAKYAARSFVEKQPDQVRIGVVSFSAHAAVVQEPTTNREDILAAINRLRTQRGTAVGSGLLTSLDAIFEDADILPSIQPSGSRRVSDTLARPKAERPPVAPGAYAPAVVVLLTDGQSNQGPSPLEVAQVSADLGVRVYTVGVGSPQGAIIGIFGRSIRVRLDEESLKGISDKTDAAYFEADSETDLNEIYQTLSTDLVFETEKTELTVFFAAFAVLVLIVGATLSQLWLGRLP